MTLVDTSIWIDHLRGGNASLAKLLQAGLVPGHSFVIVELACGNLRNRGEVLRLLQDLPGVEAAQDEEALCLIDAHRLMGRGIGYMDAHLLAAALMHPARLWTQDRRLADMAQELGIAYAPEPH